MKNKYYLILVVVFLCFGKTSAQSFANALIAPERLIFIPSFEGTNSYLPLSNYHFFNPYYYNPAMAGIQDKKQLNTNWNRQIDHSFSGSYEQPISSINSAIGMHYSYTSDEFSSARYYGLAYNYGFNIKGKAKLRLGFQFSQISISFDENQIGFGENQTKWYNSPSMDIGLAFQAKQFRFGVSVQNLFPTTLISEDGVTVFSDVMNGERQVNISLANTFRLSKNWDWSLAFLFRNTETQNIHDLSSYFSFRKKYFVGTTYRTLVDDPWIGFVGIKIKEKVNLQFSCNAKKDDYEDRRFFEVLGQYLF
jgi:type IX secretion system PorP/SprF family membrane protein